MPDRYNSIDGTAELMMRTKVVRAVQEGWHLSAPNELPIPLPTKIKRMKLMKPEYPDVKPTLVANCKTGVMHVWKGGSRSGCGRFRCGTPENPEASAVFLRDGTTGMTPCPRCEQHH